MDELEKRKMVKKGKVMHCLYAESLRKIVDESNQLGILREDIVTLLKTEDCYSLIYFK